MASKDKIIENATNDYSDTGQENNLITTRLTSTDIRDYYGITLYEFL